MGTRVVGGRYALEIPEGARPGCRVWRARDGESGASVEVALLDEHPDAEATLAALAAVRHPSLPVVLDRGVDGAARFAVTPARSGSSARAALADGVARPVALDLAAGLADALAALHAAGLVQGRVDLAAVALDGDGPPRFEELATAGLARPPVRPEDDVRALAVVLRGLLGIAADADPLQVPALPVALAGLLGSMGSPAPPAAAAARDVLRRIAREADGAPVGDAAPTASSSAEPPARRRGLKALVGALAVLVLVLVAVVAAQVVDRRDADSRAAATSLPGPVVTGTAPPAATTTAALTTTEGWTTTEGDATTAAPAPGPQRLVVADVVPVDPAGDGHEQDALAMLAVDGSPATGWRTEVYVEGAMASKGGLGLRLHLEAPARLRRVVLIAAPAGATAAVYGVRGAVPAATVGATPSAWTPLAAARTLGERRTTIPIRGGAPVTDVLIWLTGLPQVTGGEQVELDDVALIGVPAGA